MSFLDSKTLAIRLGYCDRHTQRLLKMGAIPGARRANGPRAQWRIKDGPELEKWFVEQRVRAIDRQNFKPWQRAYLRQTRGIVHTARKKWRSAGNVRASARDVAEDLGKVNLALSVADELRAELYRRCAGTSPAAAGSMSQIAAETLAHGEGVAEEWIRIVSQLRGLKLLIEITLAEKMRAEAVPAPPASP